MHYLKRSVVAISLKPPVLGMVHAVDLTTIRWKSLYETLGVDKKATDKEIKAAFYAKSKMLHPDSNQNEKNKTNEFILVKEAYETLRDRTKRQRYDNSQHNHYQEHHRSIDHEEFWKFDDRGDKVTEMSDILSVIFFLIMIATVVYCERTRKRDKVFGEIPQSFYATRNLEIHHRMDNQTEKGIEEEVSSLQQESRETEVGQVSKNLTKPPSENLTSGHGTDLKYAPATSELKTW